MTDLAAPPRRPIDPDAPQYNATLVRREDQHESLAYFWVRFDGEATPFEAGQYMTIGVMSTAGSCSGRTPSPRRPATPARTATRCTSASCTAARSRRCSGDLPIGHRMRIIGPKGKFMLQPDDERTHLFISSGTGNAPFVAMMRELLIDGRPRPVVFLNGVSYEHDLGYRRGRRGLGRVERRVPGHLRADGVAAERPANAEWTGRTGRVESILGAGPRRARPTPGELVAYICGNPDMILTAEATLLERGYPEEQVHKELYWPKGKEPRGVATAADAAAAAEDE